MEINLDCFEAICKHLPLSSVLALAATCHSFRLYAARSRYRFTEPIHLHTPISPPDWLVSQGTFVSQRLDTGFIVSSISWSPNSRFLAYHTTISDVYIWDLHTHMEHEYVARRPCWSNVAWSPDSTQIAYGLEDGSILLRTIKQTSQADWTTNVYLERDMSGPVWHVNWSANGAWIASSSVDKTICIWSVLDKQLVHTLHGHSEPVVTVHWSRDSTQLVSAARDGTIRIWRMGECMQVLRVSHCHVHCAAWSPTPILNPVSNMNRSRILTVCNDTPTCIWDYERGTRLCTLQNKQIVCAAWSPDARMIVSGSRYGNLFLWDANTGILLREYERHHKSAVRCVAWSPDGRTLASGSNDLTIHLWHLDTVW